MSTILDSSCLARVEHSIMATGGEASLVIIDPALT